MKIAVLGSDDSAHAVAFEWAKAGHSVYMYDFPQYAEFIYAIANAGGIYSVGEIEGYQKIVYAGTDLEKVISGTELAFVVGPASRVELFGKECALYAEDGQIFVVIPSSGLGALAFKNALGLQIDNNQVTVAETHTIPYMARITGPAKISVFHKLPAGYKVAALPRENGVKVYEKLRTVFTGIEKAESVLQTTLQNCTPVTQPVITTLNAALIERTGGNFFFYNDGVTPAVGNIMKVIDKERIAIGKSLGLKIENSIEIGIRQGFLEDKEYTNGYAKSPEFDRIIAQSSLNHRFYNEDIGYSMICWIDLADKVGMPVPMMNALTTLVSGIMQRDYRKESPRTLERLGLSKYSLKDLQAL